MNKIKIFNQFTLYAVIGLLILTISVSYYRFIVLHDYDVSYEIDCDPAQSSCYIGCEDEECMETYFYARMQKYAPNIKNQCGLDITDCPDASECLPSDNGRCLITYCDIEAGDEECVNNSIIVTPDSTNDL